MIEIKRPPHLLTHSVRLIGKTSASNERQWFRVVLDQGLPQPLLTPFHGVKRVKQVRARPVSPSARHGAIVWDRKAFLRRLREEQVADPGLRAYA